MNLVTNINMLLGYLLEGYIVYYYFSVMFERKRSGIFTTVAYGLSFSLLFGIYFLDNSVVNMVALLMIMSALGIIVFKAPILKALFHSAIICILIAASEMMLIALLNIVFRKNIVENTTDVQLLIVSTASKLLVFVFCRFITLFAVKDAFRGKRSLFLFLEPLASLFAVCIIYYMCADGDRSVAANSVISLTCLSLLVANLVTFYIYEYSIENEQKLTELKLAEQRKELHLDHYRMLQEAHDESRIVIHDIKHHLLYLRSLAEKEQSEEALRYLNEMLEQPFFQKSALKSGNKIVDTIIMQKDSECKAKGIELTLTHDNINLSFVSEMDLCCIMSNLLDNALAAAQASEGKYIHIKLYRSENNSFYFIEIVNSCDTEPKRDTKGYVSTKSGKYHGIGLHSVATTIEKYGGEMYFDYSKENREFKTSIMLQKDIEITN
ncbi:MAG: sensor histidine kinase [Ruminococcus sp.]